MTQHPASKKQRILGAAAALLRAIESPDGRDASITVRGVASARTGHYTMSELIDAMTMLIRRGAVSTAAERRAAGPDARESDVSWNHSRNMGETETCGEGRRLRLRTIRDRSRGRADSLQRVARGREEARQPSDQDGPSQPALRRHRSFSH